MQTYEDIQVVKYEPGGFYEKHFDSCNFYEKICQKSIQKHKGARYITIIIYLNPPSEYEGGTTEFVILGKKIKLEQGDALFFYNLNEQENERLYESIHRGNPLIQGQKWIANIWIRKKFNWDKWLEKKQQEIINLDQSFLKQFNRKYNQKYFEEYDFNKTQGQYIFRNKIQINQTEINQTKYHELLGDELFYKNKYENSIKQYNQAIKIDPKYTSPYFKKGLVLIKIKQFFDAYETFYELIQHDPENELAYAKKGYCLFELGMIEDAADSYMNAMRIADQKNN